MKIFKIPQLSVILPSHSWYSITIKYRATISSIFISILFSPNKLSFGLGGAGKAQLLYSMEIAGPVTKSEILNNISVMANNK